MNEILTFINSISCFKFDTCKKVTDDWNGSKVYLVTSKELVNMFIGFPVLIKDTNGKLEKIISHKEILKILNSVD